MKKILVRRPVIMVQTLTYHHLSFKTFTLHSPWPYVTLSVFTTLLICFFAHRLWNKFKQTDKTTIHLELTTVTDCMVLPIASLPLCPDNWHIQPPEYIDNFILRRKCNGAHLSIDAPSFTIQNKHTNKSVNIPLTLYLSPIKAFKLR